MESSVLASNLKTIRSRYKLNQADFARALDLTYGQYKQYEISRSIPSVETFIKLQRLTGIGIDTLVNREIDILELKLEYDPSRMKGKGQIVDDTTASIISKTAQQLRGIADDLDNLKK